MIKSIPFWNLFILAIPLILFIHSGLVEPMYLIGFAFFGIALCFFYIIYSVNESAKNKLDFGYLIITCYELIAFIIELSVAIYITLTSYKYV